MGKRGRRASQWSRGYGLGDSGKGLGQGGAAAEDDLELHVLGGDVLAAADRVHGAVHDGHPSVALLAATALVALSAAGSIGRHCRRIQGWWGRRHRRPSGGCGSRCVVGGERYPGHAPECNAAFKKIKKKKRRMEQSLLAP